MVAEGYSQRRYPQHSCLLHPLSGPNRFFQVGRLDRDFARHTSTKILLHLPSQHQPKQTVILGKADVSEKNKM
eukprot:UN18550